MNTLVLIGGALLIFLSVKDKLPQLWQFVTNFLPDKKSSVAATNITSLTSTVEVWVNLRTLCEQQNRVEALTKLDELFPLLNKVAVEVPAETAKKGG